MKFISQLIYIDYLLLTGPQTNLSFPKPSHLLPPQTEHIPKLFHPPGHIDNSISVHLFLKCQPQLGKSKELNNQWIKEERSLQPNLFILPKNSKKTDRLCMKFSLNSRGALMFYFNVSFFCLPHILRIYQPPGQNQQNGKQYWLPRLSFKISFKDTSFHTLASYISPECLLIFRSDLYIPPSVRKIFKVMIFTLLESALNLGNFIHALFLLETHSPQIFFQRFLSSSRKCRLARQFCQTGTPFWKNARKESDGFFFIACSLVLVVCQLRLFLKSYQRRYPKF